MHSACCAALPTKNSAWLFLANALAKENAAPQGWRNERDRRELAVVQPAPLAWRFRDLLVLLLAASAANVGSIMRAVVQESANLFSPREEFPEILTKIYSRQQLLTGGVTATPLSDIGLIIAEGDLTRSTEGRRYTNSGVAVMPQAVI